MLTPNVGQHNNTVATTGNDITLDTLLIRLHLETACRRGAAIRLRQDDIDETWCQLRLREKNNTVRWHPASPTLIQSLITPNAAPQTPPLPCCATAPAHR